MPTNFSLAGLRAISLASLLLAIGTFSSNANAQTFIPLGHLPSGQFSQAYGISADGTVVIGEADSGSHTIGFRWTATTGIQWGLFDAIFRSVNTDGSVIVGKRTASNNALRWVQNGGWTPTSPYQSVANSVSADGSVVVGSTYEDAFSTTTACRWTSAGSPQLLRQPTYLSTSVAYAITPSGSMIVGGYSTFNTPSHAFVWTQPTGMVDLGTLPGETSSRAFAVNRDGSVIVGQSGDSAFRQTRPGTMTRLNPITPGASSQAFAVNASGSVISGTSAAHAVIWTNTRGLIDLNTYLPAHGINLTDWTLLVAYGISADGRTIVGSGSHNGLAEGWVVTLPVCLGDFNLDGDISADDIFAFLSAWFARDPRADIDISGIVNEQDIFAYISAWFGGC